MVEVKEVDGSIVKTGEIGDDDTISVMLFEPGKHTFHLAPQTMLMTNAYNAVAFTKSVSHHRKNYAEQLRLVEESHGHDFVQEILNDGFRIVAIDVKVSELKTMVISSLRPFVYSGGHSKYFGIGINRHIVEDRLINCVNVKTGEIINALIPNGTKAN